VFRTTPQQYREIAVTDNTTSGAVYVDPWRCRMWEMHDRASDLLTADVCRDVIRSFKEHGQMLPALGRRARNVPGIDVELIYGARRLYAAQHLNVKLAVDIVDIDDNEAIHRMYIENAHRSDLSPYERGMAFKRWLREGCFASQGDLAERVGVSVATVSRLLSFALLPAAIIEAFPDPRHIREEWAIQLARNCRDLQTRSQVASIARRIATSKSKQSPSSIFRQLMRAGSGERKKLVHDHVVHDQPGGEVLMRVRETDHNVMFIVSSQMMTKATMADAIQYMRELLISTKDSKERRTAS
jgi:ParB family transcriptional regulator, chromosome partitioning protein